MQAAEQIDTISPLCFHLVYIVRRMHNKHYSRSKNLNSVALVRKRTIPTERPTIVGEVSANFLRIDGVAWSAQLIPTAVNLDFQDPTVGLYLYKNRRKKI
jgi:hypothetical protein